MCLIERGPAACPQLAGDPRGPPIRQGESLPSRIAFAVTVHIADNGAREDLGRDNDCAAS